MEQYAYILRSIAARVGVPPLKDVAQLPGTKAAYRVIVHYETRPASDAVTTLRRFGGDAAVLEVVYQGHFAHKPITRKLTLDAYTAFSTALQTMRFDHLPDQPNVPLFGADLWLIERGAGSFVKSVIVAPQTATGQHANLIALIREHFPEAVREIAP